MQVISEMAVGDEDGKEDGGTPKRQRRSFPGVSTPEGPSDDCVVQLLDVPRRYMKVRYFCKGKCCVQVA